MSETRIRPRFELEDGSVARLEPEAPPLAAPPRGGVGTAGLAAAGAAVLVLGLAGLDVGNFVAAQFARSVALGWITLGVAAAGFGLLGAAGWGELRGLLGLRRVDHLRAELADPARTRRAALAWLATLPDGAAPGAVAATADAEAIVALLRAGPVAAMRARAEDLARAAAIQVFALAAAVPSPALDGVLVAWRGIRLVRQVAALYGVRPGLLATLSLLRRVAYAAAAVAGTDFAANAVTHAVLSNKLLANVAGDVAGAGVAARRMIVLARVTAAACSPLGPG